jgi:predicted enzyme related to lactoylglutathione lyase
MFLGLRTVIYHAPDLAKAKAWYAEALGVSPYFDEPFYVGFEIGGFELGLDPDVTAVNVGNNAVAYWGVADIEDSYARLLERGAESRQPVSDIGGEIKVATVVDPFGNVIGLIQNPHFTAPWQMPAATKQTADREARLDRSAIDGPARVDTAGSNRVANDSSRSSHPPKT